ncbi:hypothetical protein [uncultured Meiothermus sp.]|jgi:bacterioferritin-associated ferredoxin|uniref:hypothetical protein n=1 Tax=uncultured Meiothermus sp. TaxID=157471 RepID=UPI002611B0EC|nr:hypothetical protein [uncultured Meiothermus sp.]
MNGLFAFIEQKEAETQQTKALLMPLLEALDSEKPWTSANFWAVYALREGYDPVIQQALEHLKQYAVPLLEIEEALAELDLEQFSEQIAIKEEQFWQEAFVRSGPTSQPNETYLCGVHALRESEVRGLVLQNLWDAGIIASALGSTADCLTCKRGIQRVLLEELKRAKAQKSLA